MPLKYAYTVMEKHDNDNIMVNMIPGAGEGTGVLHYYYLLCVHVADQFPACQFLSHRCG